MVSFIDLVATNIINIIIDNWYFSQTVVQPSTNIKADVWKQTRDDVSVDVVEEIDEEEYPYWQDLFHPHSVGPHHLDAHWVIRWHDLMLLLFLIFLIVSAVICYGTFPV